MRETSSPGAPIRGASPVENFETIIKPIQGPSAFGDGQTLTLLHNAGDNTCFLPKVLSLVSVLHNYRWASMV